QLRDLLDAGLFLVLHFTSGVIASVLLEVAFFTALIDFRSNCRAVCDEGVELFLQLGLGFWGDVLLIYTCHNYLPSWGTVEVDHRLTSDLSHKIGPGFPGPRCMSFRVNY